MKISLQPKTFTVPGISDGVAVAITVVPSNYQLGVSFSGWYEVKNASDQNLFTGINALTDDQFKTWAGDDTYVAQAIAQNLGLMPA